jgi:hypothetical protein
VVSTFTSTFENFSSCVIQSQKLVQRLQLSFLLLKTVLNQKRKEKKRKGKPPAFSLSLEFTLLFFLTVRKPS